MNSQSWIAIDVGNSRTKFGLFDCQADIRADAKTARVPLCRDSFAVGHREPVNWSRLIGWNSCPVRCIAAGSNPPVLSDLLASWPDELLPRPIVLDDRRQIPIRVIVTAPDRVGLDRLLHSVAAIARKPADSPAIVVDTGTATTVDWITPAGEFAGGAILPGFKLSARALHEYTALLPLVNMLGAELEPPTALGRETTAAIKSGIYWGQLGAVKEVAARLTAELLGPTEPLPPLFLTGGGAPLLTANWSAARHEPYLALEGLVMTAMQLASQEGR